ncbi:uncharacterized protein LOC133803480 [Humulus lupulus]|uniref:uncharacterized protein LOC133803480 n=1 Tax=Humulus lupulus TaxID=3486 RepID=UPI002B416BBA|nr:uncharacterized protein LOC133803480 [Humulus lupulus]
MSSRREETEASDDTSVISLLQSQTGSSLSFTSSTTTTTNNLTLPNVDTTTRTMEEIWKDIFTENDDLFYNDLLDSWSDSGDSQYNNRRIRNRESDSEIRAHNARMEAHMNYLEIKVGVLAEQNKRLRLLTAEVEDIAEVADDYELDAELEHSLQYKNI